MITIEQRADLIATAIKLGLEGPIKQDVAKLALRQWAKENDASADDVMEISSEFLNLSALNQSLEKFGIISTSRAVPALMIAIKKELAKTA